MSHTDAKATFSGDFTGGVQIGQYFANASQSRLPFRGSYSNTGLARSPSFIPRPQHQELIEKQLLCEQSDREPKLLVISGFGGVGKSQLALNYLLQHGSRYTGTCWIEAGSVSSIERDYRRIFHLIYPGEQPPDIDDIIPRVKIGLQDGPGLRLVVFDEADTIEHQDDPLFIDLARYILDLPGIHIIITTRVSTADRLSNIPPIRVRGMEDDEALRLFQTTSGIEDQEAAARTVVSELGNFALAITLAGCYIKGDPELATNLDEYIQEYRANREELLRWCPTKLINQYGRSTLSTWNISFNAVKHRSHIAANLLTCLSFLNLTDIFLDLFRGSVDSSSNSYREVLANWQKILSPERDIDIKALKKNFHILVTYSFVDVTENGYSMHRLVHEWGLARLSTSETQEFSNKTAIALCGTIEVSPETWQYRARLIPHLTVNSAILRNTLSISKEQIDFLKDLDWFDITFKKAGQWHQQLLLREYIHKNYAEIFGDQHLDTIAALSYLASTVREQGRYGEAASMRRKVLEQRRAILGDEHPDTIGAMRGLAATLSDQGKLDEAASMEQKVLEWRRANLGDEHPQTIYAMHSLAETLRNQRKLDEAASIAQKVLEWRRANLGEEHPDTIRTMHNLAATLYDQGKPGEAASMEQKVLEWRRVNLGDEHPDTITAMHGLAITLHDQGKLDEAASMERKVLGWRRANFGDEHPETIKAMQNLAVTLSDQGKLDEAASMEQMVLGWRLANFSDEHPETIIAMQNLAATLQDQGKLDEAASMEQKVLEWRRANLGDERLDTIRSTENLAVTLCIQDKREEAIPLIQEAAERAQRILGYEHPDTIRIMKTLKWVLGEAKEKEGVVSQVPEKKTARTRRFFRIRRG